MAFKLVAERKIGGFNFLLHFECACTITTDAADAVAHFFKQLVIFVIGLSQIPLRPVCPRHQK